jgi:hypothetical protein
MSETTVDLAALRRPFRPEEIGKLPRVTCPKCAQRGAQCSEHVKSKCGVCQAYVSERHIHLDYVGHADVTSRLLEVDPAWNWEPMARDERGLPVFDLDSEGQPVGLWIRLTVGGVTRLGYGSVPSGQPDAVKVLIGDSLRNAAMRFGVAVDLWAKGDRADPAAENATASAGQAARRGRSAGDAFEDAAPARPQQRGRPGDGIDAAAQAFAEEAHKAATAEAIEDIRRRAREAGKVTALVRNPAGGTGKLGQLAVYLDWRGKQLSKAALSPEDEWALRIAEIPDGALAEAAQVYDDLADTFSGKAAERERFLGLEASLLARFPELRAEFPELRADEADEGKDAAA